MRIGIVSDTHGLLRPQVLSALAQAKIEHILHAGDVGDIAILDRLGELAPVTAIRGNIDTRGACVLLPPTEAVVLAGKLVYLVHSVRDLDLDPVVANIAMVVSGHSHAPSIEHRGPTLYLNPGSCGPRRFKLPVTLSLANIREDRVEAQILELDLTSQ